MNVVSMVEGRINHILQNTREAMQHIRTMAQKRENRITACINPPRMLSFAQKEPIVYSNMRTGSGMQTGNNLTQQSPFTPMIQQRSGSHQPQVLQNQIQMDGISAPTSTGFQAQTNGVLPSAFSTIPMHQPSNESNGRIGFLNQPNQLLKQPGSSPFSVPMQQQQQQQQQTPFTKTHSAAPPAQMQSQAQQNSNDGTRRDAHGRLLAWKGHPVQYEPDPEDATTQRAFFVFGGQKRRIWIPDGKSAPNTYAEASSEEYQAAGGEVLLRELYERAVRMGSWDRDIMPLEPPREAWNAFDV
jgi:hypothetical protein